jgi:hypothetical protein
MKKIFVSVLAASTLALGVSAAVLTPVEQLNSTATEVLQSYQNAQTQAKLEFISITSDDQRVNAGQVNAFFKKVGTKNILTLKLDSVKYAYNAGKNPTTAIAGSLGVDLTKLFPAGDLNGLMEDMDSTVKALADDYIRDYGPAVTLVTVTTEKNKDAAGNYVSVKCHTSLKIDLAQLPASKKVEDQVITGAEIDLVVEATTGLTFKGDVYSNTGYKGFRAGELGLKESLDKLLARDPVAIDQVKAFFNKLNDLADGLIN